MIGTKVSIALFTAVPMAPDELSTCSRAGESYSRNFIAPSAASTGSLRATCLISSAASLIRLIGVSERHPKACRRKRDVNSHLYLSIAD
jgi:hypothetical protein